MNLSNRWKKKIEIGILTIIFAAIVFMIPTHLNHKRIAKRANELTLLIESSMEKNLYPYSYNDFILKGTEHTSYFSFQLTLDDLSYNKELIKEFSSQYLTDDNKNKALIQYILTLIEFQRFQISNNKICKSPEDNLDDNKPQKLGVIKSPEYGNKIMSADTFVEQEDFSIFGQDENDGQKTIWGKLANSIDYIFIVSIVVVCLITVVIHKIKNDKWTTMSDLFLVVIAISTCFTSFNHLFSTVPSFVQEMPTFDAAIFALGPVAVIWLAIKGIFDLLYPSKNEC